MVLFSSNYIDLVIDNRAYSKRVPIDKLSLVITFVLVFVFLHEEFYGKIVDRIYFDYRRNIDNGFVKLD